jgi:alkanesulfonate monooxygenase SsuD/methylene tetrahydromethanopterin reductase-like flavin-dependent oxidoreductase (luciferase family)
MQFGLFTLFDFFPDRHHEVSYLRDTLDLLVEAEGMGYDSAWVGEEHFYSFGICPSPQIFLTALAQRTRRMRLGTAISVMALEHPLRKAEDFAMLDILSNGRVNFGVGRGGIPAHFAGFGIDLQDSRARSDEALQIIEKAWTLERFSHEGRFWKIPELSLSPRPLQKPCPPIFRGVLSPEGFPAAAAQGHSVFLTPLMVPERVMEKGVVEHRAALASHGHRAAPNVFIYFLFIDQDYRAVVSEAREVVDRYIKLLIRDMPPREYIMNLPPGDGLRNLLDMFMSTAANVEERTIVGTPADCRRRIAELRARYGIEHIAFYLHPGGRDIQRARAGIELFAREVMPEFKDAAGGVPATDDAAIVAA